MEIFSYKPENKIWSKLIKEVALKIYKNCLLLSVWGNTWYVAWLLETQLQWNLFQETMVWCNLLYTHDKIIYLDTT